MGTLTGGLWSSAGGRASSASGAGQGRSCDRQGAHPNRHAGGGAGSLSVESGYRAGDSSVATPGDGSAQDRRLRLSPAERAAN